jgi:hypothetical protein
MVTLEYRLHNLVIETSKVADIAWGA